MKKVDWIYLDIKKNELWCKKCGGTKIMPKIAMEIKAYLGLLSQFKNIHKNCG